MTVKKIETISPRVNYFFQEIYFSTQRTCSFNFLQVRLKTEYLGDTWYKQTLKLFISMITFTIKISKRRGIYDQGSINTTNTHKNTYKSKI